MTTTWSERWLALRERLDGAGDWLAPLGLRLILAWEFWTAGTTKLHGRNWFESIRDEFPFPFDHVPTALSWQVATWTELLGAIALALGLCTRFFAFSLLVLTAVATASVHWPMEWMSLGDLWMGYAIRDEGFGNFKLPLLFAIMLLPLLFKGAGKLSVDALLAARAGLPGNGIGVQDPAAWGLAAVVLGAPLFLLVPVAGLTLLLSGALLLAFDRLVRA
jgi:putative oxidoreductase